MLHPRKDYEHIQDPSGKIPANEPVFLLRAQDKVAARTVRAWADYNVDAGGDPALSKTAREYADKMDAWPVKKLADLPTEQPAEQAAEQPAEQAAENVAKPESKSDGGVVSQEKTSGALDSGIVSEPDQKSENKPDSGVV